MLSKLDKKIIVLISQDIPLTEKPFRDLALKLGIEQKELFKRLRSYKKKYFLRKFCATLNHRKIGYKYNAMVVWNIPERLVDRTGSLMAAFTQISHCYERKRAAGWNYNLYSMIHGRSKKECLDVVRDISRKAGCRDYKVLFSSEEYKKTPVKY